LFFLVASKTTALPSAVLASLALCWILYVPFGIGNLVTKLPIKFVQKGASQLSDIGIPNILIKWILGFLLVTAVAFLLGYSRLDMVVVASGLLLVSIVGNIIPYRVGQQVRIDPKLVRILLVTLILGITFAAYIRSYSPYPLSPGADIFTHIYVIKSVINNAIEDSPLQYAPTFDVLIALASSTFDADLVEVFWLGTFMLAPFFSVSLYVLAYTITRNHINAVASTIIGLSLTEQGLVPNLQVFYPSSFLMSIFPIAFFVVDAVWKKISVEKPYKIALTSIVLFGLVLIHFQLGLMASALLLIYIAATKLTARYNAILLSLRIATIAIAIVLIFYYNGYINSQLELRVADGQYAYDTQLKIKHLKEWYTPEIMTIGLFGIIAMALFRQRRVVLIGFLASILFLIYFQKIDLIHRYIILERPLLAIATGTLLTLPLLLLTGRQVQPLFPNTSRGSIRLGNIKSDLKRFLVYQKRASKASILYLIIAMILLAPILTRPFDSYTKAYSENGADLANFTNEELAAAKWIEQNTPTDYTVFSDPFTVLEMRGLAYRKNIEAIGWNATVANLVKFSMNSTDPADSYHQIISQFGDKNIIVVTPRTSKWINGTDYFVQFPVKQFVSFTGFDKFYDEKYFTLLYQSDNIFVFVPNKPESDPSLITALN
jgi:hypothetical protein